ncbi:MAG: metallophosphoesterase family protein [Flavobacteriales bacterium]
MTRIGLISDTHSWMDDRILHHLADCNEIWHAGDIGDIAVADQLSSLKPLRAVYGNIDNQMIRKEFPEHLYWEHVGLKILMIHIAGPFGKYTHQTQLLLQQFRPDILVCGHSHILKIAKDHTFNVMYMNPGAAGKHGFHQIRTMLKFDLDQGQIKNAVVVELGKRAQI